MRTLTVALLLVALTAAACSHSSGVTRFSERGLQLEVPHEWRITGFSTTNSPRRLVAASYPVRREDVEGDCGGIEAVARLPEDGAFVVVIDYADAPVDMSDFQGALPVSADALFEPSRRFPTDCFGSSYMMRLNDNGRPLQIHAGLGSCASRELRAEVLAVVNSITPKT